MTLSQTRSKGRNPKSEIRKKAEIRNPDLVSHPSGVWRFCGCDFTDGRSKPFEFRPSDFGFKNDLILTADVTTSAPTDPWAALCFPDPLATGARCPA